MMLSSIWLTSEHHRISRTARTRQRTPGWRLRISCPALPSLSFRRTVRVAEFVPRRSTTRTRLHRSSPNLNPEKPTSATLLQETRFIGSTGMPCGLGCRSRRVRWAPASAGNGITEMPPCAQVEIGCVTTSTSAFPWYWQSVVSRRAPSRERWPSFQKFAKTYKRKATPKPFSTRKIAMVIEPPLLAELACFSGS